ncbi:MAG: tetratricopeptide repeat protein [Candidatus Omnitrophota bacterium]
MKKNIFTKILVSAIITLSITIPVFAQEQRPDFNSINGPSGCDSQEEISLQDKISGFFHNIFKPKPNIQQARLEAQAYRQKGIELQKEGTSESIEKAEIFFKQAIELDPYYAGAYNDLGVIYEAKGSLDIAQQYYQKAIEVNPDYLNSYSNLALLYEGQGYLKQAYYYWSIRAEHGDFNDEWTKKARLKVEAIRDSVPDLRSQYLAEIAQQMDFELNKELGEQKRAERLRKGKEIQEYLDSAVMFYKRAQYQQSIEEFKKALSLDPSLYNSNKIKLMAIAQERLKTQTKKDRLEKINQYFEKGMNFCQKDDLQAAKQEFDKISELTASPQGI